MRRLQSIQDRLHLKACIINNDLEEITKEMVQQGNTSKRTKIIYPNV